MSHFIPIRQLLLISGFSTHFKDLVETRLPNDIKKPIYLVTFETANFMRFILDDFTRSLSAPQTLCYTKLSLDSLQDGEIEKYNEEKDFETSTLGPGFHQHPQHSSIWLCYENTQTQSIATPAANLAVSKSPYRLALLSTESIAVIQNYVSQLQQSSMNGERIRFHVVDSNELTWRIEKINQRRPSTLFLGPLWNQIYEDAKDFFAPETEKWYRVEHNLPYKRSFLFLGEPGNGKSATIHALASVLNVGLYSLNLTIAALDDCILINLIRDVGRQSIVAIEDIDRIFDHQDVNNTDSSVSFAALLNVLDGLLTKEGILFIITCNHVDRLSDAIRRSGRIDKEFEFPNAKPPVAKSMFLSFYPEHKQEAEQFAKHVKHQDKPPNMATLQEFFVRNRKRSAPEAIQTLQEVTEEISTRQRKRRQHVDSMVI